MACRSFMRENWKNSVRYGAFMLFSFFSNSVRLTKLNGEHDHVFYIISLWQRRALINYPLYVNISSCIYQVVLFSLFANTPRHKSRKIMLNLGSKKENSNILCISKSTFIFAWVWSLSQLLNTLRAMIFGETDEDVYAKLGRIRWFGRGSVGCLCEEISLRGKLLGLVYT